MTRPPADRETREQRSRRVFWAVLNITAIFLNGFLALNELMRDGNDVSQERADDANAGGKTAAAGESAHPFVCNNADCHVCFPREAQA